MRHRLNGRKFSRTKSQRRSLLSGLACSLIENEQLKTTVPKAKDLRPYVEKLITLGKDGSLSSRRLLISYLRNEKLASKLIDTLSDRYRDRQGGYIRIIKAGFRYGDHAPMAIIELLDRKLPQQKTEQDITKSESTPVLDN